MMVISHNVIQAKIEGDNGGIEDKDASVSFFEKVMEERYQTGLEELSSLNVWGEFWLTQFTGSEMISSCRQSCL